MPLQPPPELVELIDCLGIASPPQIVRAGRAIRRFAKELQQFDSVWVDALLRAGRLTPFQAREINAGRGEQLKIGPYLLCEKMAGPPYLSSYRAKHRETGAIVRLAVQCRTGFQPVDLVQNNSLYEMTTRQIKNLSYEFGEEGNRRFFASPWIEGRTVAQWMILSGRFPPESVLEIARSMVTELTTLEKSGGCHGDIAPWNILLTPAGEMILLNAGLREIVRPEEGFAFAELLPDAYDYLAPERVLAGAPPNISSDIYACGGVWWLMLCGRPPLGGGDSLAKLRAVQTAEIPDVRRFAPETPAILAEAISACLHKDPSRRPESLAKLAPMLGPPSKDSRQFVAHSIDRMVGSRLREHRAAKNWPVWLTAIVGCISVVLLLLSRTGFQPVISNPENVKSHAQLREPRPPKIAQGKIPDKKKTGQAGNPLRESLDRQVRPVGYNATEKSPAPRSSAAADYLLETATPQALEELSLKRGQRVIGRSGRRATILVPATGLKLDGENIRLENLDFLWEPNRSLSSRERIGEKAENAAVLLYSGSRAEFRGCRFFTAKGTPDRPAILRWTDGKSDAPAIALPSGRLQFKNCIFHRVGAGIDCRRRGAIALDADNCLMLETAGLLRLDHQPELDEPISFNLTRFTMHKSGPLFYGIRRTSENRSGEFAIQAENCVFSLRQNEPLLAFEGIEPPDALLRNIHWNGSDSLIAAETPVIAWKTQAGPWELVDDTTMSIAGLVRSRLEFAENAEESENPVHSARLIRWQAPLPTLDPPGMDEGSMKYE